MIILSQTAQHSIAHGSTKTVRHGMSMNEQDTHGFASPIT
jgi:hypothetical protein